MPPRKTAVPTAATSPLTGEHAGLGAQLTSFAGWHMPLKYAGELSEHHAVRTSAGLFDLSHMGEIAVVGPEAGAVLDYALAGRLSTIGVGRAKYSLLCDHDGGVVDDVVVYRIADHHFLVVANAANTARVFREITTRSVGFAATVRDESADLALLAVQGPASESIVAELVPAHNADTVTGMKYYGVAPAVVAGVDVLLARTGYTGEDGFELYVACDQAVPLWRALLAETTAHGGVPAGLACRDSLRLEAGMPLYGHELSLDTDPYQAGLGRVVQLDKNFVGRDALETLSRQRPRRRLVGLRGSGRRAARPDYRVLNPHHGREVGTVTSGALSPTLGYPIALAYLDIDDSEPGTELAVDIRGTSAPFVVTAPPFYRRSH